MKTACVLAWVASVVVGCVAFGSQEALAQAPDVGARVAEIFRQKCVECHGSDVASPKAGFKGVELVDELLKNPKYVTRFDPANSLLYQYLSGMQSPQMPKDGPPLSSAELALVRAWIRDGRGPVAVPGDRSPRPFLDDEAVVGVVHADLRSMPAAERVHYRYITYTNLWNERMPAGASPADQARLELDTEELVRVSRLGLAKMLNSLSWSPSMAIPKPIDEAGLVERIDLRQLLAADRRSHWTNAQWEMLCARYPYGRSIGLKEEEEVARWLGTGMPFVRADWFVHATSRPPLYHDLLGLPGGEGKPGADRELERMLGVDVGRNIASGKRVARAAVRDGRSGVSHSNRLLERHELADGAYYWKSYDFEGSVGNGNLVTHPFGPADLAGLPEGQREFAFGHAGSEIMFSLPNGLNGYLVVKADGTRLDGAPPGVAFDREGSSGGAGRLTTGVSCIACHSDGVKLAEDQILESASRLLPKRMRDELGAFFPEVGAMDRMQRQDRGRFEAALSRLGIPAGCDEAQCEVVRQVSARFAESMTLQRAAAEFGMEAADFDRAFAGRLKSQLEEGAMSRAEFERVFGQIVGSNPDFGEMTGCGAVAPVPPGRPVGGGVAGDPPPKPWNAGWDAEVLRQDPDPTVVTDAAARARMAATKLPWKVRDRKTGIVMLLCPPGEFTMGSPASEAGRDRDETQHRRTIGTAFYIGESEVTQEQWERVMGANPSRFKGATNPVEQVSWNDCKRFCDSTGLRLPSEAEWEYGCRAGTTGAYSGPLDGMGWYGENSGGRTHAVETKKANPWGLFDMHGNVWEWCEDGYGDYPAGAGTQAAARAAEGGARVLRGGGWSGFGSNCRSAHRNYDVSGDANGGIGLRVARTIG
jgi:formylglycine-generating enzyme required for sulfatase activity/mono/diheme cytochrome c family protein